MTEDTDTDTEPQRYAYYCSECQMTAKLFQTRGGEQVIGCTPGCHSRTPEEVAAGDTPTDWNREDSPFELRG